MKIEIKCETKYYLPYKELTAFQDNIKDLTADNKKKLKDSIITKGFIAPVFIWKHEDVKNVLDGTQRLIALRELELEGNDIPDIPIVYITAETEKEAKEQLLLITGRYGEFNRQGLDAFILKNKIELETMNKIMSIREHQIGEIKQRAVEKFQTLEPYKKVHVLLSFPIDKMVDIQKHLTKIITMAGVEYEQSAN